MWGEGRGWRREEEEGGGGEREREEGGDLIYFSCILGVVPVKTAGWCGAVSSADSAELPGAVQAEQVLSHLPEVGHGWGPPPEVAWCGILC